MSSAPYLVFQDPICLNIAAIIRESGPSESTVGQPSYLELAVATDQELQDHVRYGRSLQVWQHLRSFYPVLVHQPAAGNSSSTAAAAHGLELIPEYGRTDLTLFKIVDLEIGCPHVRSYRIEGRAVRGLHDYRQVPLDSQARTVVWNPDSHPVGYVASKYEFVRCDPTATFVPGQ